MLPRKHRLSLRKNFQAKNLEERLIQGKYFGLKIIKQEARTEPRFAIIVSSKIAKKATQRNRIKRLLREAIRSILKDIKKGHNAVILTKKQAATANLSELKSSLKRALQIANML